MLLSTYLCDSKQFWNSQRSNKQTAKESVTDSSRQELINRTQQIGDTFRMELEFWTLVLPTRGHHVLVKEK